MEREKQEEDDAQDPHNLDGGYQARGKPVGNVNMTSSDASKGNVGEDKLLEWNIKLSLQSDQTIINYQLDK